MRVGVKIYLMTISFLPKKGTRCDFTKVSVFYYLIKLEMISMISMTNLIIDSLKHFNTYKKLNHI